MQTLPTMAGFLTGHQYLGLTEKLMNLQASLSAWEEYFRRTGQHQQADALAAQNAAKVAQQAAATQGKCSTFIK